jgi:predicted ATPase
MASAAYASASAYFSAGMALLDEGDWGNQYRLTFSLWLERAECEFLTGNFETAERLIAELLQRGASKVDKAAAYHLKIQLQEVKSENTQAVDSALTCLRLFGIDIQAHPTQEQVQAEYETLWQTLDGRSIESLIDLPLMTNPELQAAMHLLSALPNPDLHDCLSNGEVGDAARNQRGYPTRVFPSRNDPRPGVSPLPGCATFRESRL